MRKFNSIIESLAAPPKTELWLNGGKLMYYSPNGWDLVRADDPTEPFKLRYLSIQIANQMGTMLGKIWSGEEFVKWKESVLQWLQPPAVFIYGGGFRYTIAVYNQSLDAVELPDYNLRVYPPTQEHPSYSEYIEDKDLSFYKARDPQVKYNPATGYYEYNGLTDITAQQMADIYAQTQSFGEVPNKLGMPQSTARTNFRRQYNLGYYTTASGFLGSDVEVVNLESVYGEDYIMFDNIDYLFANCNSLRRVIGVIDIDKISSPVASESFQAPRLEEVYIKGMGIDLNFGACPNLSLESIRYMIENSPRTSTSSLIDLILHPTAFARVPEDEKQSALTEKKIQISAQ